MIHELATMQEALALGDITAVEDDVSLLLADFEINLDRNSSAYRDLGMQALRAYVRALQAIDKRNSGEPIETPKFTRGPLSTPVAGGATLRDAFEGWNKERVRPDDTVTEYRRAVEMFIQLHGNLAVAEIEVKARLGLSRGDPVGARQARRQTAKGHTARVERLGTRAPGGAKGVPRYDKQAIGSSAGRGPLGIRQRPNARFASLWRPAARVRQDA